MLRNLYFTFFLLLFSVHADSQNILHAEMLGRPTNNGITIQLHVDDSIEAFVKYGTAPGIYSSQTLPAVYTAGGVDLILKELTPNTRYYYTVNYRKPGTTAYISRPEYSFTTARGKGQSFTFTVQADPHLDAATDTALYRVCLNNELADKPDFMIDLGDFLMTDKLRNKANIVPKDTITYRCNLLRSFYENTCHSVPLFIVLGNHEGEAGWYNTGATGNNIAVWNTQERKKYFLNPFPDSFYSGDTLSYPFIGVRQAYYSFTWGDALFVVLDPYWNTNPKPDSLNGWRWTLGKTQYDWLRKTLEQSDASFKFVFSHQIVGGDAEGRGGVEFADKYEWGGNNLDGTYGWNTNRPGWDKPIREILKDNKVTIFFHGHDHFYGKQDLECLVYQETPQPGLPNFADPMQAAEYGYLQGNILPNTGYIRMHVSSEGVKSEYVRAYKTSQETTTRHNRDVSASYFIGRVNCYDSLLLSSPMIWNSKYADEIVYPNPFSEKTRIEFVLREADQISITIYNEQGIKIRTLLHQTPVSAGKFNVVWDGLTDHGSRAGAGTCFYVVTGMSSEILRGKLIIE